jgi:hypothetical protein
VYEQAWPETDRLLEDLTANVHSILRDEQQGQFDRNLRKVRRAVLLHPRQAEEQYPEYAGDGVDVMLLYQRASASGNELEGLDPLRVQGILDRYERLLDGLLLETAADYRRGKLESRIARLMKDSATIAEQQRAAVDRWQRLYQLNRHTVRIIGDVAGDSLGSEARREWVRRFDRASFAWLFARRKPDRQYDWVRRQDLPEKLKSEARAIYETYRGRRGELTQQAIQIMLRARLEFHSMLYSMMDPAVLPESIPRSLYQDLLRNSGELATLESETTARLEALLTERQREQMRRGIRGR